MASSSFYGLLNPVKFYLNCSKIVTYGNVSFSLFTAIEIKILAEKYTTINNIIKFLRLEILIFLALSQQMVDF